MSDKKNIVKKEVIGVMAKMARSVVDETNNFGWPPACIGILYQPKRPTKNEKTDK